MTTSVATALAGSRSAVVNADYDGDGNSECAAVAPSGKNLKWSFRELGSSVTETDTFCKVTDYVVTGCNFDSTPEKELAVMRGSKLLYKHRGTNVVTTLSVPRKYANAVRGCGDVDGDGRDELLFRTSSGKAPKLKYDLVALNTSGSLIATHKNVGVFNRAYTVDAVADSQSDFILSVAARTKRTLKVRERSGTTVASTIRNLNQNLSIGVCQGGGGAYAPCLIYSNSAKQLFHRILKTGETINTNATTNGMGLVDSTNIYAPGLTALP